MNASLRALAALCFLLVAANPIQADTTPPANPQQQATAQPPGAPPANVPPAPPSAPPPPPTAQQAAPPAAQPGGQWVYTAQYGWVWMPYGHQYVYEAGPNAYEYVYTGQAWVWVPAPWIFGIGVRPWFGPLGPRYFGWYHFGHPWYGHPYAFRGPVIRGGPHRRWR